MKLQMRTLTAAAVIITGLLLPAFASAKTFNITAKVGETVDLGPVRSPCEGGPAPSMAKLNTWIKTSPKMGRLKLGSQKMQRSKSCKGKKLWMKQLYYTASKAGSDSLSIRFPDAGLTHWRFVVQ